MPPVTPSTWKATKLADHFSPVCPQAPPVPSSGPEALLEIPRGRLAQLRRLLPLLANQSEDCLYLNLYVPKTGKWINLGPLIVEWILRRKTIWDGHCFHFIEICHSRTFCWVSPDWECVGTTATIRVYCSAYSIDPNFTLRHAMSPLLSAYPYYKSFVSQPRELWIIPICVLHVLT